MADVPWTGTGGISDTQSYPWIILNAIFDRLSTSSLFSAFTCKRISSALQIDAGLQVPFLGVFLGEEANDPDGELNAGDIRFISRFVIGVQRAWASSLATRGRTTSFTGARSRQASRLISSSRVPR